MKKKKINKGELISDIVYRTISKWKMSDRFCNDNLENYDNWKDDLVDQLVKGLDKWQKEKQQ